MMVRSRFIMDAGMSLAATNPLAVGLGSLGIVVLVMVVFTAMRRRGGPVRGMNDAGDTARDRIERIREEAAGRTMPARMGESADGESDAAGVRLAVRLAAQLDGKAARLERLIEEATELCERMEAATARAGLEQDASPVDSSEPVPGASVTGRTLPRIQAAVGVLPERAIAGGLPDDPLFARIFALADDGLSSVDIAREVDEPTGKVELVLALRDATRAGGT